MRHPVAALPLSHSVLPLGFAAGHETFDYVGSGVVVSTAGLSWLVVPKNLLQTGDARRGVRTLPPLTALLQRRDHSWSALALADYLLRWELDWITEAGDSAFAVAPLPLHPDWLIGAIAEPDWSNELRFEPGAPCRAVVMVQGLPPTFGPLFTPLLIDGVIGAIAEDGQSAFAHLRTIKGSVGSPVFVESAAAPRSRATRHFLFAGVVIQRFAFAQGGLAVVDSAAGRSGEFGLLTGLRGLESLLKSDAAEQVTDRMHARTATVRRSGPRRGNS